MRLIRPTTRECFEIGRTRSGRPVYPIRGGGLLAPPVGFGYRVATDETPAATYGVTVTSSGSANTMGTWVSVLGTITYDLYWLWILFGDVAVSGASRQMLVNLGIGPDASNVTTVAEFLVAGSAASIALGRRSYAGPLFVPAGTQLWAQCQSPTTSKTMSVNVLGWGGPDRPASFPVVHSWVAEGENAGTSLGTAVTPGTSGAQGSYTQIVASSAFDYVGCTMAHMTDDSTMNAMGISGGVGIGAATEQDLGTCYYAVSTAAEEINSQSVPIFADIPASTRIAARLSLNGITADSNNSVIVHGFRA